jgi:selenocysteine-specific elongation factor
MRHLIAGTAGHIDHGKTALVRALTGIDTDRLEEEKRRGISIDLGFAHLDLTPELRLGLVDVPGHERFVKNMLAGATGVDLVILVVAADEGIKPQTREHFEICRLLGIERGVVALTKADLATRELVDVRRIEIEEFVAGSFLAGAEVVPVSAVSGQGLDELRRALVSATAEVRAKNSAGLARLPVDRSFSIRGHGTVVTGTLAGGSLAPGDEVQLYPSERHVRVRGVEVHGIAAQRAVAGQRTAANLPGVDVAEVHRGMTLGPAGILRATRQVDASFELLRGAKPLKHRAPVHFHAGTAEVEAEARLMAHSLDPMPAGTRRYVRFLLREPLLLLPGDRFIVRMFSPVVTIGGGTVLDIAAPERLRRAELERRCATLDAGTVKDRLMLLALESGHGVGIPEAVARTGMTSSEIQGAVRTPEFFFTGDSHRWFASQAWATQKAREIHDAVAAFHRAQPLQKGMPKEALRTAVLKDAPAFLLDALLAALLTDVRVEGETVRLESHRVALGSGEELAARAIEDRFRAAGLSVPTAAEVLAACGVDAARARALLEVLLRAGNLVRVGEGLIFHASTLKDLRATLVSRKGTRFTVTEFKEWTGVSRKYAIPLLEYLDRQRVTRREGDSRVVL